MKRGILFNLLLGLLVVNVKADYREDYDNAVAELNDNLCNQVKLHPKKISNVSSFFYDLTLCKYAIKIKDKNLKNQCMLAFSKLTNGTLINEVGAAIQDVFGDEEDSQHLSLYSLRGFRTEIRIILHLFKHLLNDSTYNTSLKKTYENYKQDLCLETSY